MKKKFEQILFTCLLLCTFILSMGCPQPNTPDLKFTVTFDVNGHGETPKALEVEPNTEIDLVQLNDIDGYYFTGWYNGNEKIVNNHYKVTKDVKITASWEKYLTVIFKDVNGAVKNPLKNLKKGYKLTTTDLYLPPVTGGKKIGGWYLGDQTIGEGHIVNSDITLTLRWTPLTLSEATEFIKSVDSNVKEDIFDLHVILKSNQEIKDLMTLFLTKTCSKKFDLYFYSDSPLELNTSDFHIKNDVPNLNKIYFMPNSVKKINNNALMGLTSVTSIHLNEGLSYISMQSFANCTSLKEINIPSTVDIIEPYFLFIYEDIGTSVLEKIIFDDLKSNWEGTYHDGHGADLIKNFTPTKDAAANKNFLCGTQQYKYTKLTKEMLEQRANSKIENAINEITIPATLSIVTDSISLPTKNAEEDVEIVWESSNENIINAKSGIVTHTEGTQDSKVTLTAKFIFQGFSKTKTYDVVVSNKSVDFNSIFEQAFTQIQSKFNSVIGDNEIVSISILPKSVDIPDVGISVIADYSFTLSQSNTKILDQYKTKKIVLSRNLIDTNAELQIKLSCGDNTTTKNISISIPKFTSHTWDGYKFNHKVEIIEDTVAITQAQSVSKYKLIELDSVNKTFKLQLIENRGQALVDQPIILYNYNCNEVSNGFDIIVAYDTNKQWYEQTDGKYRDYYNNTIDFEHNMFNYARSQYDASVETTFKLNPEHTILTEKGTDNPEKKWNINYQEKNHTIVLNEVDGSLCFNLKWTGNNRCSDN